MFLKMKSLLMKKLGDLETRWAQTNLIVPTLTARCIWDHRPKHVYKVVTVVAGWEENYTKVYLHRKRKFKKTISSLIRFWCFNFGVAINRLYIDFSQFSHFSNLSNKFFGLITIDYLQKILVWFRLYQVDQNTLHHRPQG